MPRLAEREPSTCGTGGSVRVDAHLYLNRGAFTGSLGRESPARMQFPWLIGPFRRFLGTRCPDGVNWFVAFETAHFWSTVIDSRSHKSNPWKYPEFL